MKFRHKQQGFTMIELAVVLVVIGVILAAVFRGRDVTDNVRVKEFTTWVFKWEDAQKQYEDRTSHFAGDGTSGDVSSHNGIIADDLDCTSPCAESGIGRLRSAVGVVDVPPAHIRLGSNIFYVAFGNAQGNTANEDNGSSERDDRNVMVICVSEDCTQAMNAEQVAYFEGLDVAADIDPGAGAGRIRALNATPSTNAGKCNRTTANSGIVGAVDTSAASVNGSDITDCYELAPADDDSNTTAPDVFVSGTDVGAVYYFDIER